MRVPASAVLCWFSKPTENEERVPYGSCAVHVLENTRSSGAHGHLAKIMFPFSYVPPLASTKTPRVPCISVRPEPSGTAASMVVFEAHPHGVAAMAVMNRTDKMRIAGVANLRHGEGFGGGRDLGEVGGLLITCAKEESVVKIWDYTHVEGDGTCGRCGRSMLCC